MHTCRKKQQVVINDLELKHNSLPLTVTLKRVTSFGLTSSFNVILQLNSPSSDDFISDNVKLVAVKFVARDPKPQLYGLILMTPLEMYIRAQVCVPIFHSTSDNSLNVLPCSHIKVASSDWKNS